MTWKNAGIDHQFTSDVKQFHTDSSKCGDENHSSFEIPKQEQTEFPV